MKYQDLCIRLSEILRARGINTIYFEDVNLLNSEDVIYPAAVVQLARVEQETQSDRYTIMLTIAKKRQDAKIEGGTQWINIPLVWDRGSVTNNPMIPIQFINTRKMTLQSIYVENRKVRIDNPQHMFIRRCYYYSNLLSDYSIIMYSSLGTNGSYEFDAQYPYIRVSVEVPTYTYDAQVSIYIQQQDAKVFQDYSSYNIRGVTDILAEDAHIQINSCVITPFKWKFRDECEGVTAEINLSLFFDSRCN